MTDRDFAFWLQGFFELSDGGSVNERELAIIKEHLEFVFEKKKEGIKDVPAFKEVASNIKNEEQRVYKTGSNGILNLANAIDIHTNLPEGLFC